MECSKSCSQRYIHNLNACIKKKKPKMKISNNLTLPLMELKKKNK